MKGKKQLKILTGSMIMALTATLFMPISVSAAPDAQQQHNVTAGPVTIGPHPDGYTCGGHIISGVSLNASSGSNYILVTGGTHDITLDGVKLNASENMAAFTVESKASVNLHLKDDNILTGAEARAGIHVPNGASITIDGGDGGSGTLVASAGKGIAAGIGGQTDAGAATAGNITITGGTITANGSRSGAGIGGSAKGGAGNILISGGTVTATGGNGYRDEAGGNGIGCGSDGGKSGTITIRGEKTTVLAQGGKAAGNPEGGAGIGGGGGKNASDGKVDVIIEGGKKIEAYGGGREPATADNPHQQKGIVCTTLSSNSSKNVVIYTNGFDAKSSGNFSGLIWTRKDSDSPADVCNVYGETYLPDDMKTVPDGQTVILEPGSTLIVPRKEGGGLTVNGVIKGDGILVNADLVGVGETGKNLIPQKNRKVELLVTDITVNTDLLVFTGENLVRTAITINNERRIPDEPDGTLYTIDTTKWKPVINEKEDGEMKYAGEYLVEFQREGYAPIPVNADNGGVNQPLVVRPRDLSDITAEEVTDKYYGEKLTSSDLKLTYKNTAETITLKESDPGKDPDKDADKKSYGYSVKYRDAEGNDLSESPTTLGSYAAVVTGHGNYGGEKLIPYNIVPAPVNEDKITIEYEEIYNGIDRIEKDSKSPIKITVKNAANETLQAGEDGDYDVSYSVDGEPAGQIKDVGEYTVTITGKGNYTGSVDKKIKISKKELTVAGIDTPAERPYDDTKKIKVRKIELDGVCGSDDVYVVMEEIEGTIGAKAVGDYKSITINNIALAGGTAPNYSIKESVTIEHPVTITKADPGTFTLRAEPVLDSTNETAACNVYIVPPVIDPDNPDDKIFPAKGKGIIYEFGDADSIRMKIGLGGWNPGNSSEISDDAGNAGRKFINLTPGKTYTFAAHATNNGNWEQRRPDPEVTVKVTIPKFEQNPPEPFSVLYELSDEPDENGIYTFTATIPEVKGCEYFFGRTDNAEIAEESWSKENTLSELKTGELCIGYIRYKGDSTHNPSVPRASSNTSVPSLDAVEPVISSNGGATFVNTTKITITSETVGADIYYTTDGSEPETVETGATKLYKEPFDIGKSMTIKAVATKKGMTKSDTTSATFTMIEGKLLPDITIEVNGANITFRRYIVPGISDEDIPDTLKEKGLVTAEDIISALSNRLLGALEGEGYNYRNMKFYDIKLMRREGDNWVPVTEETFPEEGIPFEIDYPEGTSGDTNEFAVGHMFTENTDRRTSAEDTLDSVDIIAGNIEIPRSVKLLRSTLQFTVHGTSPVVVAWKSNGQDTPPDDPNGDDPNGDDPNGNDPSGGDNPTGGTPSGGDGQTNGGGTPSDGSKANTPNAASAGTAGAGTGTTAKTDGDKAKANEKSDADTGVVSAIMPDTGDPSSFIPWIILIIVSSGIIVGIKIKRKNE